MSTARTREYAFRILQQLVACAQRRETITYGELARRVGWHPRPLRYALRYIRDQICRPRGLPLINAIVVTQEGHPGEGFLPQGTAHLTPAAFTEEAHRHQTEVFAYPHWNALLEELGLRAVENME